MEIVQTTFAKVVASRLPTGELFYKRLFEIAPETKKLFADTDMKAQGDKLLRMVGVAVGALSQPKALMPALTGLGERHVDYGVTNEMYQPGGEALIWTLQYVLGSDFDEEVRDAWGTVYTVMAQVITQAADNHK
jgi:nitric oxide dioxygenase